MPRYLSTSWSGGSLCPQPAVRLVKLIKFIDEQKQRGIFSQNMLLLKNLDSSKPEPFYLEWFGVTEFPEPMEEKKKKKDWGDKTPNNQNMLVEHLLKRHLLFVQNNFLCYLIKFWKVSFQFLSFLSQLFHGDVQTKHFNWEKLLFFFLFVCQHIAFLGIFTPVQQNTRFQHL